MCLTWACALLGQHEPASHHTPEEELQVALGRLKGQVLDDELGVGQCRCAAVDLGRGRLAPRQIGRERLPVEHEAGDRAHAGLGLGRGAKVDKPEALIPSTARAAGRRPHTDARAEEAGQPRERRGQGGIGRVKGKAFDVDGRPLGRHPVAGRRLRCRLVVVRSRNDDREGVRRHAIDVEDRAAELAIRQRLARRRRRIRVRHPRDRDQARRRHEQPVDGAVRGEQIADRALGRPCRQVLD